MQSVLEKVSRAATMHYVRESLPQAESQPTALCAKVLREIATQLGIELAVPAMKYCADNAAMIGFAAWKQITAGIPAAALTVRPRWPLSELGQVKQQHTRFEFYPPFARDSRSDLWRSLLLFVIAALILIGLAFVVYQTYLAARSVAAAKIAWRTIRASCW